MKKEQVEKIDIKIFDEACKPESKGDWIDLKAMRDVFMGMGEFTLIPLGVAMKLPEGYEAHIAPRSSTFKNYGIIMVNSVGVVDEKFCGPNDMWQFPAFKLGAGREPVIRKGDRICQFRIIKKQPKIEFVESDLSGETDRGGIGSTGVR